MFKDSECLTGEEPAFLMFLFKDYVYCSWVRILQIPEAILLFVFHLLNGLSHTFIKRVVETCSGHEKPEHVIVVIVGVDEFLVTLVIIPEQVMIKDERYGFTNSLVNKMVLNS